MRLMRVVATVLLLSAVGVCCDLQYEPAARLEFRRPQGWTIPGLEEFKKLKPSELTGASVGAVTLKGTMNRYAMIFNFPSEEFVIEGRKYKTKPQQYIGAIIEIRFEGSVVAYQYSLTPARAHNDQRGNLVVESEAGCVFQLSIIDEGGTGKFTLLRNAPYKSSIWEGMPRLDIPRL